METRDTRFIKPTRPTSLSLESVCYPDLDPQRGQPPPPTSIRRSQSFHHETRILDFHHDVTAIPNTTETEYQPTGPLDNSPPLRRVREDQRFPVDTVDVSVATAGGKIAPDRRQRGPVIPIRYSTIDHSFSKGKKKDVSNIDTSLSKESRHKETSYQDFTFNRSISRHPTENDYSFGSKTVKETSFKDFSLNKNTETKLPSNIDYKFASDRIKPVTRYDYRYNWEPSKPHSRYNYSYARRYKLPETRYDYSYNTVRQSPETNNDK